MQNETMTRGCPDAPFPIHQIQVPAPMGASPCRRAQCRGGQGKRRRIWPLSTGMHPAPRACLRCSRGMHDGPRAVMGEGRVPPQKGRRGGPQFRPLRQDSALNNSDRQGPPAGKIALLRGLPLFSGRSTSPCTAKIGRAAAGLTKAISAIGGEDTDFGRGSTRAGSTIGDEGGESLSPIITTTACRPIHHVGRRWCRNGPEYFAARWGTAPWGAFGWHAFHLMGLIDK